MARKGKTYEDDDGRVIADMSSVSRPNLMRFDHAAPTIPQDQDLASRQEELHEQRPWEDTGLSREDRRVYVWAALKAALLIGLVFLVGLGLLTAFLLWLWT